MAKKKIETKSISELMKNANHEEVKKGTGGKVITETLSKVKKMKGKKKLKDTYIKWTDYSVHAKSVYTEHAKTTKGNK